MKSCLVAAIASVLGLCLPAQESSDHKPKEETLALIGGRLLTRPGQPPELGTILIRGGKIVEVGPEVKVPEGAKVEAMDGALIAPAFIDVGHDALLEAEVRRQRTGNPDDRFADVLSAEEAAIDRRMLEAGIGAVYVDTSLLPASEGSTSCLVRPGSGDGARFVYEREAGWTVTLGVKGRNQASLLDRRAARATVRGAFDGADRYEKAKKKFADDWKDYEKKLAEYEAKQKKGDKPADGKTPAGGEGEAPKSEGRPRSSLRDRLRRSGSGSTGEKTAEASSDASASKADEKPKAPNEPTKDWGFETLLRIFEGKGTLRIEAHWKEDILLALELAKSRKLRPIIMGATEAGLVIDELKEAKALLILNSAAPFSTANAIDHGDSSVTRVSQFVEAGIPFALMTAGDPNFGPADVPLFAAWLQSSGVSEADAIRALTVSAAEVVGMANRWGRIAPGYDALLQVRKTDLFAPGSKAEAMILGQVVVRLTGDRP